MKTIKKGYHVEITTWENDGDAYKTERFHFENKDDAKFVASLVSYFDDTHTVGKFGNADRYYDSTINVAEYIIANDPQLILKLCELDKIDPSDTEAISDTLDYMICDYVGCWNDGQMYRVVENVECYYCHSDIEFVTINLKE